MTITFLCFVVLINFVICQLPPNYYLSEKQGECPPLPNIGVCKMTCMSDFQCPSTLKCCRTACGGTFCINSVSRRSKIETGKAGYCPETPTGPWVCSSRCSVDSDCRGMKKCCKNRCGAMACTKPEESQEE